MEGLRQPAGAGFPWSEVSAPAGSAPARSCLTCAKAKAKCVRKAGVAHCERCTRLRKECQMKEPVQRRRKPVKLTRTAQLENLENKLENLVHALSAQQAKQHQQLSAEHGQLSPPDSQAQSDRGQTDRGPSSADTLVEVACQYADDQELRQQIAQQVTTGWSLKGTSAAGTINLPTKTEIGEAPLSLLEVEALFARYMRIMAPNMPFVVFPSDTIPAMLADQKPFLMRVIATVSMIDDLPRQQAMAKNLMRQIAEKLLITGEKSLEVLQGILIYITWYHPHLFLGQQSSNLLHLAMALCSDLMIDRAPGSCEKGKMMTAAGQKPKMRCATNDERRALLGVYYASSMLCTSFKKMEAMKWNTWMGDCLGFLERSAEYESDGFLVPLVRIQHLMEDAHTNGSSEAPVRLYAKVLQGDLENITLPPAPGRLQDLLVQQRAIARVLVWEQFFADAAGNDTSATGVRQRIDGMWNCVEALHAYIELYFAIPITEYLTLPFQVYGQFAYAFMTMLRMSTLEAPGWDLKGFRERMDFAALMESVSIRFEQVDGTLVDGEPANNDAFGKWASKTRWMKNFYETKFMPDKAQQPPESSSDYASQSEEHPGTALLQDTEATLGKVGLGPHQEQTQPDYLMDTTNMPDFLYFDDAFWNSFNPNELDFGLQDMQMG